MKKIKYAYGVILHISCFIFYETNSSTCRQPLQQVQNNGQGSPAAHVVGQSPISHIVMLAMRKSLAVGI
jgi:hypothetical protein